MRRVGCRSSETALHKLHECAIYRRSLATVPSGAAYCNASDPVAATFRLSWTLRAMATFEVQRRARLDKLKVAKEEVLQSMWEPMPPVQSDCLRVAVYNVLADSLSNDGFLVRPILADWPAGRDTVPTFEGGNVHFRELLADMMNAKGNVEALQRCQAKYNLPVSQA